MINRKPPEQISVREIFIGIIATALLLEEHDVVNGNIGDFSFCGDVSLVRYHIGFLNVVIFVRSELIQGAVDGIVSSGFHLDGYCGEAVIIVNQIVYLTVVAIVIA